MKMNEKKIKKNWKKIDLFHMRIIIQIEFEHFDDVRTNVNFCEHAYQKTTSIVSFLLPKSDAELGRLAKRGPTWHS